MSNDSSSVGEVLGRLRAHCGDSEFGFRMQAMFAHVLMRLAAKILEINAQGHPDIRATLRDRELLVQVKTVVHSSQWTRFGLVPEDLAGITGLGRRDGLLAVLDCAEPAQWIVVAADRAKGLVGQIVPLPTIQAISRPEMSSDCTEEFSEMVRAHRERLNNLTYSVLRSRALSGIDM